MPSRIFTLIAVVFFFISSNLVAASNIVKSYEINGLSGDLEKNVELYLKQLEGEKVTRTVLSHAKKQVASSLKALGYYKPEIKLDYISQSQELIATIERGPVTRIADIRVNVHGAGKNDTQLMDVVNKINLKQGDILNHSHYDAARKKIESQLLELGYFDVKWEAHQLAISLKLNSAEVILTFDTGTRYQFGELILGNESPAEKYIRSLAKFKQGEPYQATTVSEYNLSLSTTPYFNSVRVYADIANRANQQVPINIDVLHKPANSFEVGGGFDTDLGPKVRFKWSKPWITENGHYLESNLNVSERQQDISLGYTIPVDDPNDDLWRYSVGYKLEDELTDDIYSKIFTAQLQRQWLTENDWVRTAFIRRDYETYRLGDDEQSSKMLMPGISYAKKDTKGGTTPYWGEQWLVSAEFGLEDAFSTTNIVRVQLQNAWLRTYMDKHLVFLKANVGAMLVDDINNVPLSLRFYAGGDQSVRGFAYESISPKDDEGRLIGGKYLLSGTVEYNYQFAQSWRLALFVDSGTATNDFSDRVEVGAGFGFRYLTPVGPVRVDHAWGLTKESKSTRLSITIGPEI
ncbi:MULTISPECIES: autotransporter assembly complex family protein [unclassified Pseudoalteromonas]|uniref:autotransporter assembly complex protein TamA n=1 Tax=unclassified Pseudoalteromonas TaxID=194690 RepID=UPI0025B41EA2|nr:MULTISPECIES: autotransporter assembly complex family protein [unclassified Pseudoalteromonas]MDN3377129.1 autotransporter assembly complex family protein [Pseudoalteromonas sp. APC 3893]MDN3385703.1 autotransporter assembly complex family protein [Pseudoalteromonas sp. APC 4017]